MIPLIIAVFVFAHFYKGARRAGRNGMSWGLAGLASFYVPVLLAMELADCPISESLNLSLGFSLAVQLFAGIPLGITCAIVVYGTCLRRAVHAPSAPRVQMDPATTGYAVPRCAACQAPLPPCATLCPKCGFSQRR